MMKIEKKKLQEISIASLLLPSPPFVRAFSKKGN